MSEMIDLKKEKNFFETRVIEYQTGGALSSIISSVRTDPRCVLKARAIGRQD